MIPKFWNLKISFLVFQTIVNTPSLSILPMKAMDHNLTQFCQWCLIDCAENLKSALFIVGGIGGNDYNIALLHKTVEEARYLVPQVVKAIKDAVTVCFLRKQNKFDSNFFLQNCLTWLSSPYFISLFVEGNWLWCCKSGCPWTIPNRLFTHLSYKIPLRKFSSLWWISLPKGIE